MAGRYDDGSSDVGFMAMILNQQQLQLGPSSTAAVEGASYVRRKLTRPYLETLSCLISQYTLVSRKTSSSFLAWKNL
jgi:hypothetical protein